MNTSPTNKVAPVAAVVAVGERRRRPRRREQGDAVLACPTPRPRPTGLAADAVFCPHDTRQARLVDASRDGLRLTLDRPVPVGAYQTVNVGGRVREAKVVRCERCDDGTWDVGAVLC